MSLQVGSIDVLHKKILAVNSPASRYNGFQPSSTVLPQGFTKQEGSRPFPTATIWERDMEIVLRDGVKLIGDVFRPADVTEKIPILLVWSPYGKSGRGIFDLDIVPFRDGVPFHRLSGFQSFEGPDPAEWVSHGYAVVNIDARGIFDSEGDHRWHGSAEGRDGYDTIEYLSQMQWCNGHVVLMGNSWLATSQWFIAAQRPPHLSAIMPLEGLSDVYRETLCRGGVPYLPFWSFLRDRGLFGRNQQEDAPAMIEKYPLMNEYWEDKRAKAHLITVPAYILASMSTGLHTIGSTRCFEDIPHAKKWFTGTQEWHDLYHESSIRDFKKFLDFFTKGVKNDWEDTPRVRVSVLRFNKPPLLNLPFENWPPSEARYHKFFLQSEGRLEENETGVQMHSSYQADSPSFQMDADPEEVSFSVTFDKSTTLLGASKAILHVSCADHHDLDVFVQLRKADKNGNVLRNLNIPIQDLGAASVSEVDLINTMFYLGPTGVLRASHRRIDPLLSKPHWPAHDHSRLDLVKPGQVVRLEIGLWPTAIQFEGGEQLILKVAGHHMCLAEFVPMRGSFVNGNKGRHCVHYGGPYDSHIEVPLL